MPLMTVTTWHLEMLDPRELKAKLSPRSDLALVHIDPPLPELNRFFYTTVGEDWFWYERLVWSKQRWREYARRPELQTWMLTAGGIPAGYFELELQAEASVEVAYFGLMPSYIGKGLGAHLLTCAIERGWARGARRVWLHTCTLDHPSALSNYQARGLRLFKTVTAEVDVPARV
jgi:GNAT superfamily N-acetyltransferase